MIALRRAKVKQFYATFLQSGKELSGSEKNRQHPRCLFFCRNIRIHISAVQQASTITLPLISRRLTFSPLQAADTQMRVFSQGCFSSS